jgi:ribosome-associated toxin RatA of RatAB toxin-antitoxin module
MIKAIAFTFRPLLATFLIFHKWPKNSTKVRLYIAFTFRSFLATLLIFHKWPKTATTKQLLSFLKKAQKINCYLIPPETTKS